MATKGKELSELGSIISVTGSTANIDGSLIVSNSVTIGNSTVNATFTATSINANTVGGNTASDLRNYSDTVAGTAYSNAATYAGTVAGTAYSNATAYADNKAANAYSNAIAYSANATNISSGTLTANVLPTSGVTAATYGNSSQIPVITVDTTGRITSATTNAVAGVTSFTYTEANNTFVISTGDGSTFAANIGTANATHTGVLKVLDSVANTNTTISAAVSSVKTAYDAAIAANTNAASAYSNAVSYAGTIAGTAYTNATSYAATIAGTAYSNGVTYTDNKAANAYSNAVSYFTSNYTASDVLTKIKTVDGTGSGLDADTVDGYDASSFALKTDPEFTNDITTSSGQGRFGGWYAGTGYTGAAFEVGVSGGEAQALAYNRDTSSYLNMNFAATDFEFAGQSSGYAHINTSFRAPIFYDSGNTSFYVDPASTSNLSALNVGGSAVWTSGNDGAGSGLDADLLDGYSEGGFAVSQRGAEVTDNTGMNNNARRNGMYRVNNGVTAAPDSSRYYSLIQYGNENNVVGQLVSDFVTGETYTRGYNSAWSAWRKVWDSVNDGSGSGLDADLLDGLNQTTAATASTIVARDSNGHITGNYILGSYFNSSAGNSENPTIGQIWTQSTGDNYLRKSTPAHFISQLSLVTNTSGGINIGNNTAAEVDVYYQSSAGYWQAGVNNYYGTNSFFFYRDASSYRAGLDASANFFVEGSVRSPIFYDKDDTTFYTDPNGHSRIRTITRSQDRFSSGSWYPLGHYATGETVFEIDPTWTTTELRAYFNSSAVDWVADSTAPGGYAISIVGGASVGGAFSSGFPFIPVEQDDIFYMECWIKDVSGTNGHYMGSIDYNQSFSSLGGNPGSYGYWVMSNSFPGTSWTKVSGYIGGFGSSTGQFVSGTKYWTPQALFNYNGGGTSYISGWKVTKVNKRARQIIQATGFAAATVGTYQLQIKNDISTSSSSDLAFGADGSYGYIQSFNSKPLLLNEQGNVVYAGDFRANIYYDRGDTSYYGDFASTSRMNDVRPTKITRAAHAQGFLEGSYNNVGGNSSYSNPIYTIGSSYNPTDSSLASMYGVGYSHPNFWSGKGGGWGLYVASNGSIKGTFGCEGDPNTWISGYGESTSSWRAPIFYDSNNTAYYIDPAASTALNINGGITFATANPYISASSYFVAPGGAYFSSGTVYIEANLQARGGIGNDSAAALTLTGGTSGYTQINGSARSPIFYDSNDTNYYIDPAANTSIRTVGSWRANSADWDGEFNGKIQYHSSYWYFQALNGWFFRNSGGSNVTSINSAGDLSTSGIIRSGSNFYADQNYGYGLVGLYTSTRFQGVFAMGDSYKLPADGTTTGNLYGIAWSYPSAGGAAGNLASHGMLLLENGVFKGAWGGGSLRTPSDIRGTIFYDYDNTGYYCDPNSTTSLYSLILSGASYFRPQTWIQMDSSYGMYWPNTNGAHLEGNTLSSYGSIAIRGSRGGWRGIHFYDGGSTPHLMFDGSSNGGIYFETGGRWAQYYHYSNVCQSINTSTSSSSYGLYVSGAIYSTGNIVAYSDSRKKENIVTVDNALDKVNSLRGVFYNKIDDEKKTRQLGVIAQEINEVVPEVVTYAEDIDEYGVSYGNLAGLFIEAFKEHTKLINSLREEIELLKIKLETR